MSKTNLDNYLGVADHFGIPSTGVFPQQNRIRGEKDVHTAIFQSSYDRHIDYPRMHRLFKAKQKLVEKTNHPNMRINMDVLKPGNLTSLNLQFDTIVVDPPPWVSFEHLQSITPEIRAIT